jgi:hypothetical protein
MSSAEDALGRDVVAALEREWESLAPRLTDQLHQWSEREPALAAFPTAPVLLRSLRRLRGNHEAEDAILAALLRQTRTDPLAGRVTLQAILPGLKNLAGRLLFVAGERDELWALLLANVWEQMRRYPLERRPRRIAANLLQEALGKTVHTLEQERRERQQLPARPLADMPAEPAGGDVEVLLARTVKAGVLSREEARLILVSRLYGVSVAALARAARLPYISLYIRRHRAERRLALFLGDPAVKNGPEKRPLSSARVVGDGLTGSAGGGAVTHPKQRR